MTDNFAEDVAQQHEQGTATAAPTRSSQQRAVDRITALFAMAEDAAKRGDEAQRAVALDKATALQIKYAIEETMLRRAEGQAAEDIVSQEFFRGETNTTLIKAKRHLLNIVARHNRGRCILVAAWDPIKKKINNRAFMEVHAHESDLRFISSLFTSLMVQMHTMMERDERAYVEEQQARYPFNSRAHKLPSGWRVSYAYAWADRIHSRLSEIEQRQNPTHTSGTALMLRDRSAAVDKYLADSYGKLRSSKTRRDAHSYQGARAGRTAADQADLGQKRTSAIKRQQIEK